MLPEGTISVIRPYRPPLTDKQFHVASHRGIDKASLSVTEAVLISNIHISRQVDRHLFNDLFFPVWQKGSTSYGNLT